MTYRDDLQAARMRRDVLARELHQVRSRKDELDALAEKEQALERELAQSARDLDQARARVTLPLLQQVRVSSPCKQRWDDMEGDERVRFCGGCEKNVYDLSALTASQAEALLREHGENLCARFFRRSDGTIITSDCPVGKRKRFWRGAATAAVATGLAAAGFAMTAAAIDSPLMGQAQSRYSDEDRDDNPAGGITFDRHLLHPLAQQEMRAEALNRELEATRARLSRAKKETVAAEQNLERLREEAHNLRPQRKHRR